MLLLRQFLAIDKSQNIDYNHSFLFFCPTSRSLQKYVTLVSIRCRFRYRIDNNFLVVYCANWWPNFDCVLSIEPSVTLLPLQYKSLKVRRRIHVHVHVHVCLCADRVTSYWRVYLSLKNLAGVTWNMASQGIWHPRVKFPRDFVILTGNMADIQYGTPQDFREFGIRPCISVYVRLL